MGSVMQFGKSFRTSGSDSASRRERTATRDRRIAASIGAAAFASIGLLGLAGCSGGPAPEPASVGTTTSSTTRETTTPRSTTTSPTTPAQSSEERTTSPAPPIEVEPAPAALEEPAPAPAPQVVEEYVPPAKAVSYANCSDAKAAGAAPIYLGSPGYAKKLDRDGDGIACDK